MDRFDQLHLVMIMVFPAASIGWFAVVRNVGILIQGLGVLLNAVALIANGMRMPYLVDEKPYDGLHVKMALCDMHMPYLCDIIIGRMSAGDVVLYAGALVYCFIILYEKNHRRS